MMIESAGNRFVQLTGVIAVSLTVALSSHLKMTAPPRQSMSLPLTQSSRVDVKSYTTANKPSWLQFDKDGKPQLTAEWRILRALMRTIMDAEGTYDPSKPEQIPYVIEFGFRKITSYAKHPNNCYAINAWGWRDCSTAAGALQWITTTWNGVRYASNKDLFWYRNGDFSPENQDLAGIRFLAEIGAYDKLRTGMKQLPSGEAAMDEKVFMTVLDKYLSRKWASAPCWTGVNHFKRPCRGTSFYGQGGESREWWWSTFQRELAKENDGFYFTTTQEMKQK